MNPTCHANESHCYRGTSLMRNSAFAGPFSSLYETAPPYDPHIATAEHRGTKHLTLNHPPKERHRGGLCWLYSSVQFSNYEQVLRRVVLRFRGGLVFQAQRMLYHSTLGSRVIKKKIPVGGGPGPERGYQNLSGHIPKRGTSTTRKGTPQESYSRTLLRALWEHQGEGGLL